MSRRRTDRRHRVLEAALFNPDLSYAERTFMTVVTMIRAERDAEGNLRHGSRAMGPDGKFALHADYLARALGTSGEGLRKLRRSLELKGVLGHVHHGTYGRPATYEARVHKGGEKRDPLRAGRNLHPYEIGGWVARAADFSALALRGPDHPDQAPAPRAARPHGEDKSANDTEAVSGSPPCPWHEERTGTPEDCLCSGPSSAQADRKGAA